MYSLITSKTPSTVQPHTFSLEESAYSDPEDFLKHLSKASNTEIVKIGSKLLSTEDGRKILYNLIEKIDFLHKDFSILSKLIKDGKKENIKKIIDSLFEQDDYYYLVISNNSISRFFIENQNSIQFVTSFSEVLQDRWSSSSPENFNEIPVLFESAIEQAKNKEFYFIEVLIKSTPSNEFLTKTIAFLNKEILEEKEKWILFDSLPKEFYSNNLYDIGSPQAIGNWMAGNKTLPSHFAEDATGALIRRRKSPPIFFWKELAEILKEKNPPYYKALIEQLPKEIKENILNPDLHRTHRMFPHEAITSWANSW